MIQSWRNFSKFKIKLVIVSIWR